MEKLINPSLNPFFDENMPIDAIAKSLLKTYYLIISEKILFLIKSGIIQL